MRRRPPDALIFFSRNAKLAKHITWGVRGIPNVLITCGYILWLGFHTPSRIVKILCRLYLLDLTWIQGWHYHHHLHQIRLSIDPHIVYHHRHHLILLLLFHQICWWRDIYDYKNLECDDQNNNNKDNTTCQICLSSDKRAWRRYDRGKPCLQTSSASSVSFDLI